MNWETKFLKNLVDIYSPTGKEKTISDFILKTLTDKGVNVYQDEVNNIISTVGNGKELILLAGHMDTVSGKLPIKIKNGILYGRGACDAKGTLAAMICAIIRLKNIDSNVSVKFAGLVEEEGASKGMRNLLKNGIKAKYAIFGEPSENTRIVIAYRGSMALNVKIKGKSGHVAASPLYENAIEKAFSLYENIKKVVEVKNDSLFRSCNVIITSLYGGEPGKIPGNCEMMLNIRFPPGYTSKQIIKKINTESKKFSGVKIEILDSNEPYETNKHSSLAISAIRSIWKATNERAKFSRKTGTGDMNLLPKKIEAISIGPGNPLFEHTDNEQIKIDEYLQAIDIFEYMIKDLIQKS